MKLTIIANEKYLQFYNFFNNLFNLHIIKPINNSTLSKTKAINRTCYNAKNELVLKHKIALFLNNGSTQEPQWVRVKKSTAFSLSLNPQTQEYDYIVDESPTSEVKSYKPQINQTLTMYKGEDDYKMIFDKFFNMKTGEDAKTDVLIVFFQEKGTVDSEIAYRAWKSSCIISVNDLNSVDSTITFDIIFGGTVQKGFITETDGSPEFATDGEFTDDSESA